MKYIKTYEKQIKHSDPQAVNNPLNFFMYKIQELFEKLKELYTQKYNKESFGFNIKKYYNDNDEILISLNGHDGMMSFELMKMRIKMLDYNKKLYLPNLKVEDRTDINVRLTVILSESTSSLKFNKYTQDVFNEIKEKLKKYIDNYYNFYRNTTMYEFPFSESNKILKKIENIMSDLVIKINTLKYNI